MVNSILNHTGLLTFSSIDTLLTQFKVASQKFDIKFSIYKKILTVMIESLENVCKYTDAYQDLVEKKDEFLPSFEISMNSSTINLTTSNPVRNEHIDLLKEKIELVNNKNREELKQLYVETITNGKFSAKGGAGLGFIEMAKSSGNHLGYKFERVSDEFSIYTFIVTFTL